MKKASLLLLGILVSVVVFAQSGGIVVGTIKNEDNGEPLIGVSVSILQTTKKVSSDISGNYTLAGVNAGSYTLEFSYLGFAKKQITDVEVQSGKVTTLNVVLSKAASQELEEVVIRGTFKKESINALYAQQKNSAIISDGISSEQIKRSPDKNTSEALRRVSGTTIQDNKFVIIRGLSDRYNVAMLDGSVLPSTEANRRAFSFDIIPSNLIDKLIISKTATPDLPADFAGGAVQVTTKDIPERNSISFGLGYGYNTASTFKDFYQTKKNFLNYAGYDDGSNKLAKNFPSLQEVQTGLSAKWNRLALKSLPNDFAIQTKSALPSQTYQFTLARVKNFADNSRFGAIFSINYRNAQTISPEIRRDWYVYNYTDNQYKFSTNLGALANFAYAFNRSKITWKNLYNQSYDNVYLQRTGTNGGQSSNNKFFAYDILQKSLFKSTLEGEHALSDKNDKLKWTASWSNVVNDQPNQMKINYQRSIDAVGNVPYLANITSIGKENTRLFSHLNENIWSGDVAYSLPMEFFNTQSTFKAGVGAQYRKRNFDARFIGFELNTLAMDIEEQNRIRGLAPDEIFNTSLIDKNYYKLGEVTGNGDKYDANSLTNSGYLMMDQKIVEKFRAVYGVRVENYNIKLNTVSKQEINSTKLDVLPSVNLIYSLTSKTNLRASYYRTIARPELRELASFPYYDYENMGMITGNVNLKRSSIQNVDVRFETYPSAGEVLSISAFYKGFTDAIEPYRYDVNSTPDITYFNTPKATLYGVELEARKNLTFIVDNEFAKNTIAYVNLSLVHSKVDNLKDQKYIDQTRPMVGQSPYVINAGLQHSAMDNKLNFNVLYNRIGKRISQASGIRFASTWEAPRNVLDFQVGYKVLKTKGEIKLNAGDILNNPINVYYDNSKLNQPNETNFKYKPGSNYSLSFSYSF